MPGRENPPDLKKYMSKRLSVRLNGNRTVIGRLSGFDVFMNLVLEEAEERLGAERRELGVMIIRGNSIVQMECLDVIGT